MTSEEIKKVVDEMERLWRSRTPATRVDEVNASYRVSRGEMRLWCGQNGIKMDEFCDEFNAAAMRMFVRLRKEFPNEKWEPWNEVSREQAKRLGVKL